MKSLILIVEDDIYINKCLKRFLDEGGIDYLFALDSEEAIKLFKKNEKDISHIALDFRIVKSNGGHENTSAFAKIVAESTIFKGKVFAMSARDDDNDTLMYLLGMKCEQLTNINVSIKLDTINAIIDTIKKEKRGIINK